MTKVSVLIAAYNEEATILDVLVRVRAQQVTDVDFEIIVINDGSKDRTLEKINSRPDLYDRLVSHEKNAGKGAAVRSGLRVATGDFVLFQDADLEYDPAEYHKLLVPVQRFEADVVMGSRFMAPQYTRVHYFWHKAGNGLVTGTFNLMFNKTFTDIYSCYLLFRRNLLEADELRTDGWQQQAELLSLAVSRGRSCYEVPISYHGRTYEEGKKIHARHALSVLLTIVRMRFRRIAPRRLPLETT